LGTDCVAWQKDMEKQASLRQDMAEVQGGFVRTFRPYYRRRLAMAECILAGCDLHGRSLLLKVAVDRGKSIKRTWANTAQSRLKMIDDLKARARSVGARRIVFAYEACGFGFVLRDELTAAGIECHVLAPTRMPKSVKRRRRKTDEQDAEAILRMLRGYVLAGMELPSIWIPDPQVRDDRELVRRRLDLGEKCAMAKTQMHWLLARNGVERPKSAGDPWSVGHVQWLHSLAREALARGTAGALESLLRQVEWLSREKSLVERQVASLSGTKRYGPQVEALCRLKGVGVLTAMTFLTELGAPSRFGNRREVGSYLGLTPSSHESGEADDRKGHITHQGPSRVRKVLCQAVWSRVAFDPEEQAAYQRLVKRNPKKKKIAIVARMRHLAILMWHTALDVQRREDQQVAA